VDIIVGGGKYGCNAIGLLRKKGKSFVVVDTDSDCEAVKRYGLAVSKRIDFSKESFVHGDLSKVLKLINSLKPEYVFPTAPVHIAADLAQIKFNLKPWVDATAGILQNLPPMVVLFSARGKLILSYNRDHDCLDECSMPTVCPTSRIKKPCTMTDLMRFACPDAFVLVSHSMAPGMGALKGSELTEFFDWAKSKDKFVVGTACDCHGVFSAFKKASKNAD
jgi:hypothetical protein